MVRRATSKKNLEKRERVKLIPEQIDPLYKMFISKYEMTTIYQMESRNLHKNRIYLCLSF